MSCKPTWNSGKDDPVNLISEDYIERAVHDNNTEQLLVEAVLHLRKISFYLSNMVDFDINNQDISDL